MERAFRRYKALADRIKQLDEQANYDYGRKRKRNVKCPVNPYNIPSTAEIPVREVPARSGDNPLRKIK